MNIEDKLTYWIFVCIDMKPADYFIFVQLPAEAQEALQLTA